MDENFVLSEEAQYWWFIGQLITYIRMYGLDELLRDAEEVSPGLINSEGGQGA